MSTSFSGVADLTLQGFCDDLLTCVTLNSGATPAAAPNAFKDRLGEVLTCTSGEVTITIRIGNGGTTASVKVVPDDSNAAPSIEGQLNITTFATILA